MEAITTVRTDPAALRKLGRLLLRVLSVGACVAAWQWASAHHVDLGLLTFQNVPAPWSIRPSWNST
jgi:NitT/TauT family transport system permease protein